MPLLVAETGSFRDPSGRVYRLDDRILRSVNRRAVSDFEFVRSTGLIDELSEKNLVLPAKILQPTELNCEIPGAELVIEAPTIPFISFPYEWCHSALKKAALCHLDIQIEALERGVMLSDASAYNIQFRGGVPVFIDHLSFRRYRDGEIWTGHRQFCEQFLNPLLLRSFLGVNFNSWYRGSQEGIEAEDLRRLLKWRHKLKWGVWTHVVLQASLQKAARRQVLSVRKKEGAVRGLPLSTLKSILRGLHRQIEAVQAADAGETLWRRYESNNSYTSDESEAKRRYISEFCNKIRPTVLWDLGCNAGDYSKAALQGGASYVVGFDFDLGALETAFARAGRENLRFLPLYMDATNPSPAQGWRQSERQGLQQRGPASALIALAFIHHLAIAKNIPLDQLVEWLTTMAPIGVVEFVPKSDPMVQRLLAHREDIFDGYDLESFAALLARRGRVVDAHPVSETGRTLFWYDRS
jgi:ribosomal protein L11 methylase PrmA